MEMMQQAVDWSNIVCGLFTLYCAAMLIAQARHARKDEHDESDDDDDDSESAT